MKIDGIDLYLASLPLKRPQETNFGTIANLETVLVRVRSGDVCGWGEASPGTSPLGGQWARGSFAVLRDWFAPALVGRSIGDGNSLAERLAPFAGNQYAKAALDTAWWDLKARLEGKPLPRLLQTKRETVELGVSFDRTETIEELFDGMRAAFEAGFARIELKIRPGWDINMINVVRQEFGTETLHVDIEGAMTLSNMETLCRLDDFMLAMVEQPLLPADLVGHAMVQEALRTPICLEESIVSTDHVEMALDLKSCKFINLGIGRVGGLTPAVAIHDACHANCTPCRVGSQLQTAIGMRHGLALASKENCSYPADWFDPADVFEFDLADAPPLVRPGDDGPLSAQLWADPGIGVIPDTKRLESCCIDQVEIA
jgi:O-succinylbenzoate synthase